ncbi:MAG: HAMP domain-containing histidine kinase [Oligoflexales bacterium]|nr:HAMP domain-containing histidine kinase [Oligoflexales bacterium]
MVMAFVNLLSNSCDAIEGLKERWIKVQCMQDGVGDRVTFKVFDSGHGISKELDSKIFKQNFTTKSTGKGTGLGLSFVKKVIEAHQGNILVDHNSKHTCFVITLPYKNAVHNQTMVG